MFKINSETKTALPIEIRFHKDMIERTTYSKEDLKRTIDLSYCLPEVPKIIELVYPHHIQLIYDLQTSENYKDKRYFYTKTYIEIIKQSKGGMIVKMVGMRTQKQHFFPKDDNILTTIDEVFEEINRAWDSINYSSMI